MLDFTRFERVLNSLTNSTRIDVITKNESIYLDRLNSPYYSHREMSVDFNGHGISQGVIFSNNNHNLLIYNKDMPMINGHIINGYFFKGDKCRKAFICVGYFRYRLFLINSLLDRLQPIKRLLPDWLYNPTNIVTFVWNFTRIETGNCLMCSKTVFHIQQKIEAETEEE